jgi:hypothetical protein
MMEIRNTKLEILNKFEAQISDAAESGSRTALPFRGFEILDFLRLHGLRVLRKQAGISIFDFRMR